jgi:hypothetical protein
MLIRIINGTLKYRSVVNGTTHFSGFDLFSAFCVINCLYSRRTEETLYPVRVLTLEYLGPDARSQQWLNI